MDEKNRNNLLNMQLYIDYIKAIENPDKIGWNGKVWIAPQYKGYDKNQRGYGIDIVKNDSAKRLTQNRPGQWLTEEEADKLMKEHLLYIYGAALKHIEGFDNLSDRRKAVLLGMLYRGDSVNKNRHIIDINEPDDNKFFESINNYYKSKGLNERAKNSSNFFNNQTNFLIPMKWEQWEPPMKFKSGGQVGKMLTAAGGPLRLKFTPEQIAYFESRGLPSGMNNSKNYREEGVLALLYQELEKAKKELEIASRMEMKPVLVKKASRLGEKDLYKLQVNTAAGVISPVDPVAEFFMYGNPTLKGAEALFKTGLLGAARFAPRTQLGNYGRLYFVNNAMKFNNLPYYESIAEVPLQKGYMYHSHSNPSTGFVKNGVHWNNLSKPGALHIKDGKYVSTRYSGNPENDRIWWDLNGHNLALNVYVTRESGYTIDDPQSLAIPGYGSYHSSYRTTPQIDVNSVVKFKYDPIGNTYILQSPFRSITTNRMSIEELFTPETKKVVEEPLTSLKFFERKPAKSVTREYVQSPKDITSDVGDLIAEGSERSVYTSKSNPNIVYKIEDGNAPLENINNIKIRSEINDDIIAPETTIGYYKHKNGKYYRVTQLDKYKSFNPDNYDADLSPKLNLEIINTLEKAGWKVNIKNGLATTASKNGIKIRNLEYFNWGRDPYGNLKLIDLYVYSLKQGGKMNTLLFLKNGSGIHIKKKNRGKYFKSINKYVNV